VALLTRLLLACAVVCVPAVAAAGAAVEGTVSLPHEAPAPASAPRYPVAAGYTVGPPDPPAALVYLDGEFAPGQAVKTEMAQRHYQFAPGLLAVPRGSVVTFPNLDEEYHSVFSYSKTKRFDLGRYRKDEDAAEITFDQAGIVKLYCEIHDHMRGTIVVLESPYFTKTDADGRYRLEGLPAGRHVLRAWIDEGRVLAQAVDLRDGATVRADFASP
jgi:plastocyanin